MMWMHKITWKCGIAVFKWVLVTKAEFARTAHLTGAMIKIKAAKLIVGGGVLVGIGCVGTGIHYGPQLLRRPNVERTTVRNVPEPGTLVLLTVGIGGLIAVRRRR